MDAEIIGGKNDTSLCDNWIHKLISMLIASRTWFLQMSLPKNIFLLQTDVILMLISQNKDFMVFDNYNYLLYKSWTNFNYLISI